jgi:F-type H+-transporting ATPase subunit epsilon
MVDASSRELQCVVVTPERALVNEPADFVVLPMYDGELGVLPGRAPLVGRLWFGELRVRRGEQVQRFFVDGGFAQVRDNTVTVLTPRAQKANELKPDAVQQAYDAAKQALATAATPENQDANLSAMDRARVQQRMLRRVEEARR